MASSTLTLYKNHSDSLQFVLQTTSQDGASYVVAGRQLSQPYTVTVKRKLTAPGASGNDRVTLSVSRTEKTSATGKLATGSVSATISVPKDSTNVDRQGMEELISILRSALDDGSVRATTSANMDALLDGRDL